MAAPRRGQAYDFDVVLGDSANRPYIHLSPPLAVGDVRVQQDDSALINLVTLPVVMPAGSGIVHVSLGANEMQSRQVTVVFHDVAGAAWDELVVVLRTEG